MAYGAVLGQTYQPYEPDQNTVILGGTDYNPTLQTLGTQPINGNIYLSVKDQAPNLSYVRNIYAGIDDMTAGTAALTTGRIYLVYE